MIKIILLSIIFLIFVCWAVINYYTTKENASWQIIICLLKGKHDIPPHDNMCQRCGKQDINHN